MKPRFFARNSLVILMIIAFLMPFMFVGTKRALRSNKNDVKSWLPAAYEETQTYKWYREHFENETFVLASWDGCTLDAPALELMAKKLCPPPPDPESGRPIEEPLFFQTAMTGARVLKLLEEQGLSPESALNRLKGCLIGPDGKQTCLVLTVVPNGEEKWEALKAQGKVPAAKKYLHALVEKLYEVAENECAIPAEQLHLGGPPIDNVAIDTEGEKTLLRLAGVSAAVGLFMSWWCLRSWPLTGMVFTTALFSAGISLAVVWYSGTPMNAILLTMPSLVYVAATSGAIHLANYYRDAVREHGIDGAPDRTIANAWLPLALATGTTAIGLASMYITELMPIRLFGVYSAIGVVISFFVLCTYTPAALQFWPLKSIAEPRKSRIPDPGLSPRWRFVGEFIIRHNRLVTVTCLLVMGIGIYGTMKIETSVKLMRMFSDDAKIIRDYAWLEEHLGPLVPMEVVVRIDKSKCKLDMLDQMKLVGEVQRQIESLREVGSTLAATTFARALPKRPSLVERRVWLVHLNRNRDKLGDYIYADDKEQLWRVSARIEALTDLNYGFFVKNIREAVEPVIEKHRAKGVEGIEAVYTGLVPLIYKAQNSLLSGLIFNFVGDLILIGVAIIILLRDWSAGFLLGLPSLFPMACVFGAMGLMGVVVDTGTVMVPAVALGVTVDDAIHFMLWCRHGQERGMNHADSIMFAYGDCARAIYQSWGVIGLGLASFALSSFIPTQRFGVLMFVMLTVSSIGNLVLLPALLAGPAGWFFWRKGEKLMQAKLKATKELAVPEERSDEPAEELVAATESVTIPMVAMEQPGTATRRDRPHRRSTRK
jgi:predicted RND superfamily exporter protein